MRERLISIIGAGVVGTAIGEALESRGFTVAAVAARSQTSRDRAGAHLSARITDDSIDAARAGDIIFITTSDDLIQSTCDDIAANGGFDAEDTVFHMSGALGLAALSAAANYGARIGSIHPMQTFPDVDAAIEALPGTVFGVTADGETLALAEDIVYALGGEPFIIRDEDKAIYHAAACAISNYLVALVHFGENLYKEIGIPKDIADKAFLPLIRSTVNNIQNIGTSASLTGPIARGDADTIKTHLLAMENAAPWAVSLYRELGEYTVKVAVEKGTITEEQAASISNILKKQENVR